MNNMKTKNMVTIALMTAITCIVAPFTIPLPFTPVPISLANLVIYISCCVLGCKKGTISFLLYLLLGAIGLPVFGGFSAGLSVVAGPTGGYLIGFIFCAIFTGIFVEKFEDKMYMYPVGMIIGTIICYAFGTAWLAFQLKLGFVEAMFMGVIPYLIGDGLKIALSTVLGYTLRSRLASMNLINA
ncbi:biotin transporter BioY [Clostridium butyricum]|uniref:biotin transporter BioY n=1 Tax=Clostridium butyricum TaxID=1492 RepID=UPI00051B38E4|nr:biotin transporter BioY [Clostridium butyricum]QUF82812.1 biotin transporter BioY [Clostridium butyricum]